MSNANRLKRFSKNAFIYTAIIVVTLAILDVTLIALDIFPPGHDYGNPDVGWVAAQPTGTVVQEGCVDLATGNVLHFTRNEDGLRSAHTARELRLKDGLFKIAVGGDSHTELCAQNDSTHFGVLERELTAGGVEGAVFAYGAGKYSPLQAYLALRTSIAEYRPDAIVLNLYTGNDFYDMLRVDDRPHFVRNGTGYALGEPVWYRHDDPTTKRRSRVLFALRSFAAKAGLRQVLLRIIYLSDVAASQDQGLGAVLGYTNDLRKAAAPELGYPQAFTAQMLNQQLFFRRFPGSREESIRRVQALLELVRRENPGTLLIMSPLPSYQLVHVQPRDSSFLRVLSRIHMSYERGVAEEEALYSELARLAHNAGWAFIDNLTPLRHYTGDQPLYNEFDYHLLPVASEIIGKNQAASLMNLLQAQRDESDPVYTTH